MAEFKLTARTPLDGPRLELGGLVLEETAGRALVSLAVPLGGEAACNERLLVVYGVEAPAIGHSTAAALQDGVKLLRPARDQVWVLFDAADGDPEQVVRHAIGDIGYVVDQSDGWAMVRLTGSGSRDALERICPLDMHPAVFQVGRFARTVMEHLAVVILREGDDAYVLMSPRSSAQSFWHALATSMRNVA